MRAIMILATVTLVGCEKGGGDSDSSVSAQTVSGSYAVKAIRPNGDIIMIFAKFTSGQYVVYDYKFTAGNMAKASYVKWTSTDIVSGTTHAVALTYATCPILNGVTGPTTQSFPVTPLNNDKILVHSNGANADIMMDKIASMEQWLADAGTYLSTEVTDCSVTF